MFLPQLVGLAVMLSCVGNYSLLILFIANSWCLNTRSGLTSTSKCKHNFLFLSILNFGASFGCVSVLRILVVFPHTQLVENSFLLSLI